MANLGVFCWVLCFATVAMAIGPFHRERHFLNDGSAGAKLRRIEEYTEKLAALIKNLAIATPSSKIRLTDMANELLYTTQVAVFGVNQAIPSIKNKQLHDSLCQVIDGFSELAHQVQHHLHGDSEKLREQLAHAIDKTDEFARKIAEILQKNESKDEIVLSIQLRKSVNSLIYAVRKLKYKAEFIKKTNKELEVEIDAGLEALCKVLGTIKNDDPKTKEELIHLIQNLERVEEFTVTNLENLVHIKGIDEKYIPIITEVSGGLSSSCDVFHQLTSEEHDVAYIKTEFEKLYRKATALFKKLVQVEAPEDSTPELIIRSALFDSITLSKVYELELGHPQEAVSV